MTSSSTRALGAILTGTAALVAIGGCASSPHGVDWNRVSAREQHLYFPVAAALKTPVGALACGGVAVAAAGGRRRSWWKEFRWRWAGVALGVPFVALWGMGVVSTLDIGIRHMLPVYPIGYVAAGVAVTRVRWRRPGVAMAVLLVLLVVEVVGGRPDYIAFFNWPARVVGPVKLLGDSNLDWGQDVKGLVAWQGEHPNVRLYAAVYGSVRPWFYGLRYEAMPGVPFFGDPDPHWPEGPGVMAVSATVMQGIFVPESRRGIYGKLMGRKPDAVIGGTIYLFETKGGVP